MKNNARTNTAEAPSAHNMEIVQEYSDYGRSGLNIAGRDGLNQLMADVEAKRAKFTLLLVYETTGACPPRCSRPSGGPWPPNTVGAVRDGAGILGEHGHPWTRATVHQVLSGRTEELRASSRTKYWA